MFHFFEVCDIFNAKHISVAKVNTSRVEFQQQPY